MKIVNTLKEWALPLAMITGSLFYKTLDQLSFLVPGLLFAMIFVTYCRLSLKEVTFHRLHLWLMAIQISMSIALFFGLGTFDPVAGQAIMICILAPTAAAAAVITAMLGGNLALLASYTLFSNFAIALIAPILFPLLGIKADLPFLQSLWFILKQIFPLLIVPFIGALLLSKLIPQAYHTIRKNQSISFYLWAVSLTIVTARTVRFLAEHGGENVPELLLIAGLSLIICILQFLIGRFLGRHFGDVVSGGQALGQKNTVLAIWMAQAYMHPLASLGPASYILWQNSINTLQLWKYRKKTAAQLKKTQTMQEIN
ncbi:MAG: hypothetical protein ACWA6U_02640 [Breznakibacter sp.]